jgi:hypothetical protein
MRKLRQAGPIVIHSPFEMYCRDWQTRLAGGEGDDPVLLVEAIPSGIQYPWMSRVPFSQELQVASGL